MKNTIFTGAAVAIITPMHSDGSINYDELGHIIDDQIENGTDAVVICGTTGESATMTDDEHLDCIKFAVKHVAGRIPVIAGAGSNDTRYAVELSKEAEAAGADALLHVTPYYNKATQKGLKEHFKMVAESVKIPIILYNIPGRTGGVNIQPETVVSLCRECKNIVGVKDATGNLSQIATMMSLANGDVDLYSGNDDQVVPIMSLGGIGVISVLSNVAPKQTHDMCQAMLEGDVKTARDIQLKAIDLISSLFCEVNPIPVKKAMELLGKDTGFLRRPLTEMEPEHAERLKKSMEGFGIL